MRIGKSNVLFNMDVGIDFSITGGGVADGNPEDLFNPDFSYFPILSGINPTVIIFNQSLDSDYIAIHGIRFNAGPNDSVFVRVYDDTTILSTTEIIVGSSIFVTRPKSNNTWKVEFFTSGGFATVVAVSYIAAGIYTDFPRSGVRGGEYLPYLGNNRKTLSTSNQFGQPVTRSTRAISKEVTLKCPNAPMTWIKDDLRDIFRTFNAYGILSVQMIDSEPNSAFAGWDLEDDVRVHPQSLTIGSFTLKMKSSL